MGAKIVKVRLVFAAEEEFHAETVDVPAASLEAHPRLVDCLREDEAVQSRLYLDVDRLALAYVVD